ncbi:MAG TPA: transposase [Thiothrix sp.]|nr:transposase [Thiothrix sp.]
MASHDESYKNFFKHPEMVADLLRGFVDAPWVNDVDFSTLEKLPHEYTVDKKLIKRASDTVWRVRCYGSETWLYIVILLEFQSRPDPVMAFRMMSYVSLLYLDFYAEKRFEVKKQGKQSQLQFPPIFPIVLYNGKHRWHKALEVSDLIIKPPLGLEPYRPQLRYCLIDEGAYSDHELTVQNLVAALFRLEKSQKKADVVKVLQNLIIWLDDPEQSNLSYAFSAWLTKVFLPKHYPNTEFYEIETLEGVQTMLAETVQGWYKKEREKGRAEGRAEGKAEGRVEGEEKGKAKSLIFMLETRFEPLSATEKQQIFHLADHEIMRAMEYLFQATSLDDFFAFISVS